MTSRPALRPQLLLTVVVAMAAVAGPVAAAGAQATDGTISNVAGTGVPGAAGDGGPATAAQLNQPGDVAYLAGGAIVIADTANNRVRRIGASGTITTVAGTGTPDFTGDGGPATGADLDAPGGVTALPDGGFLLADTANQRIRRVHPDGTIVTVAGSSSSPGLGGDGGPATAARLNSPADTFVLPDGGFLIADAGNGRVRRVAPDGTISTLAGTTPGFAGDGGPATGAQLAAPSDVTVDSLGRIVITDTGNSRLRRIAADGTITTIAGTTPGLSGDGDPARGAQLSGPASVAALTNGGLLLADTVNARIRRVTPLGAIIAVAGTSPGRSGDGGAAQRAKLRAPGAVTLSPGGGFLVADTQNNVVRQVSGLGAIPPAVLRRSIRVASRVAGVTVAPLGNPDGFLALREDDIVPAGSGVDATSGKIALTAARDATGFQQVAEVYDGPFTVSQVDSPRGTTTDLRLPALTGCDAEAAGARAARTAATAAAARAAPHARTAAKRRKARKRRRSRRVWVSDRGGNWRTSTGSTSASSIGTRWATTLLCDGTRITVGEGRVRVRDRRSGRSVVLRPGQSTKIPTTGARRGV